MPRTLLGGSEVIPSRYVAAYARRVLDHRFRGPVVVTVGGVVALIGTFLPWLRSGSRNRSSYTIFDLVERLGFAPGGVMAWSLRLWPLVPLLLVAGVVTGWLAEGDRRLLRIHVGVSILIVGWLTATAAGVLLAPDVALFRIGVGPSVTSIGAVGVGIGTTVISRRRVGPRESDSSAAACRAIASAAV